MLTGRHGTPYQLTGGHRQKHLAAFGVQVVNEPLVQADNTMASYCPQTTASVGFWLLKQLTNANSACAMKTAMG